MYVRDVDSRVRSFLLSGDFGSKGRLPSERELAQELGISRPALREAVKTLADLGLIEVVPGSGSYLSSLEFPDLMEVRELLEPLAARRAATRRTTEQVRELVDALARMEASVDLPAEFAAADAEVHRVIALASGNRVLDRTLHQLAEVARFARRATVVNPATRRQTLADVSELVDRVAAGEPSQAATAMRRHLRNVGASYEA